MMKMELTEVRRARTPTICLNCDSAAVQHIADAIDGLPDYYWCPDCGALISIFNVAAPVIRVPAKHCAGILSA